LEVEEEERNKEVEERDATIESLREQLANASMNGGTDDRKFDQRMRIEVEGFQEQVKDLCIQLEESAQKLEKESKARADAEAGKKRLEKALLELNAKLQATPTKSRDADAQIAYLKDELERSRTSAREALSDFDFDPELFLDVDDSDIDETGDHVRVKLSDIQRVLKKLHQIVHDHHFTTHKYTHEVETHETNETAGGEEEEVVEDEEEGDVVEEEEEKMPNGHDETLEEEGREVEREEEEVEETEEEIEDIEAPATPNGMKHVHFGTPSPPSTPPNLETTPPRTPPTATHAAPLTPTTPSTPTTPNNPNPTKTPNTLLPNPEAHQQENKYETHGTKYCPVGICLGIICHAAIYST